MKREWKLIKWLRELLMKRLPKPKREDPSERDVSCECPICGFMGSRFEIICHYITYHTR